MTSAAMARIAADVIRGEPRSDSPKYRRIIAALAGAIEHGTPSPGDRPGHRPIELDALTPELRAWRP